MITTLGEILPHAARKHADRTALIIENRRFSFRELDRLSSRVANGLIASGLILVIASLCSVQAVGSGWYRITASPRPVLY